MSNDFFSIYQQISDRKARRQFRKEIIAACKVEPATFYSWLYRKRVPNLLHQEKIAEVLNKPQNELFPNEPSK